MTKTTKGETPRDEVPSFAGWSGRTAAELDRERADAFAYLGALDDHIAALVRALGPQSPYGHELAIVMDEPLAALSFHIVSQQISRAAATAIFGRLVARSGGSVDAAQIAGLGEEELRAVGLSHAKARAIRELSERVAGGDLDLLGLRDLPDSEAYDELVGLRGIGPWSAQVFMMRELLRPDVFPSADIGLRQSVGLLDGTATIPSARDAATRAEAWAPYRSYASAYLWGHHPSNRPPSK